MANKTDRKQYKKKYTISNLARKYNVTRQALYKMFDRKGWDTKNITSKVVKELDQHYKDLDEKRKESNHALETSNKKAKSEKTNYNIELRESSTIKQRLENKKQEYNFNRNLISDLQLEIEMYLNDNGSTTMLSNNGTQVPIPQLAQLEKYQALNLKVDKHIQDLETAMRLVDEDDEDPFKT